MKFLKQFQLHIRYETGTELLTSLRQDTTTQISNHIHEWRCRWRLVKPPLPEYHLADWFCKSLLPQIAKDVALGDVVTEDQSIHHSQHLDLICSESRTLYNIIPNAPRNSNVPPTQQPRVHVDGIIGASSEAPLKQLSGHIYKLSVDHSTKSTALPTTEINSV